MRAIFLDRDGTVIDDPGYLADPEGVQFLPGALEALARFQSAGYALVIVSNQSGIGRGLITAASHQAVHRRFVAGLEAAGIRLAGAWYCAHLPDAGCACRKPRPGLLLAAAAQLGLDLSASWMIGDKESDVEAGLAAGCRALRLDDRTPDLLTAADLILSPRSEDGR